VVAAATNNAPEAPVDPDLLDRLDEGDSLGLVDGLSAPVETRVGEGTVVVNVDSTSFQVSAPDDAPGTVTVDADGRVFLGESMTFKATVLGMKPGVPFEIWLYSRPIRVREGRATSDGGWTGTVTVPAGAPRGWHNLLLSATETSGKSVAVSMNVNLPQRNNFVAEIARSSWVWVLIALAVTAAFLLPGGGLRRRRRTPV
jgi:hypothetical protein